MKLCRFGPVGQENPGILDAGGKLRDLSEIVADIDGDALSPTSLKRLREIGHSNLPVVADGVRIGACVAQPTKIIGVGMNYRDHIRSAGVDVPKQPTLFMKPVSTITGPDDDIILPARAEEADWEVELAVVIGTLCRDVKEADAGSHVAGYCLANDITERKWIRDSGQLLNGKSLDCFTPIGPWLVTTDEEFDPSQLNLTLSLNGEEQQNGNTADLVFGIDELVSRISQLTTLMPGDIILTGTPAGVGMRQSPSRYLRDGDKLVLEVTHLGTQRQKVVIAG